MKYSAILVALIFLGASVAAQVPSVTGIEILKAEDTRNRQALEKLFAAPHPAVRARAALAAGRIGDEAALPFLRNLLATDKARNVLIAAAFAIGEIESEKGADAILEALANIRRAGLPRSSTTEVLKGRLIEAAGKVAAAKPAARQAGELRKAIVDLLREEERRDRNRNRETISLALTAAMRAASRDAKRNRPDEIDLVVAGFLSDQDARIRADAANALARLRAKNANDVLRRMLGRDVDPIVRANAARALAASEDKAAVDELIAAATSAVDSRVRVSAIRALATLNDAKAAEPLLARGETLFEAYKRTKRPGSIPPQQNEFIEIAVALGRLLSNTRNERAVNLFRKFGKLDRGFSTEVYIARLRIAPGRGDDTNPELNHWRQYSTLAQLVGEFAALEPTTEQGKQMKAEAPGILRPMATAYAEADPAKEADTILAAPDVLRAYARFKTEDLSILLRTALMNKDLFIRATAAELLAEQPVSDENLAALNRALEFAIVNDTQYNDAVLATIDALFKLDKRRSLDALALAAGSLDHLVRAKVVELLKDPELQNPSNLPPLRNLDRQQMLQVGPYSGKHTKLGQVLNTDVDYRRALSRKNGSVHAVLSTQKGVFTIDLLPEDAPLTVDNFIKLARSGYFNGLEVHRVVPNFVMQDGDPRGDGNGGPGWSIRCEINMVRYERGVVGMALSGKDTGGSQWFVTHSPQPHLDGGYTVFGRVDETGMKVVDRIVRGDKVVSIRIIGR